MELFFILCQLCVLTELLFHKPQLPKYCGFQLPAEAWIIKELGCTAIQTAFQPPGNWNPPFFCFTFTYLN
jgi:hypothetical protein